MIPAHLQEAIDHVLKMRGVDDPCEKCHGIGVRTYASTATWRGGMGAAKSTKDVCDTCWGTGDKHRTGVDLRKQRDEENARVAERALNLFADKAGVGMPEMRPAILGVAKELDSLAKGKNKPRPPWFSLVAEMLAKALREGCEAAQAREDK